MIVTALLVKWSNGWHEIARPAAIAAHGRKEGLLGLGAVQSLAEVATVAGRQLEIFGDPRTEIACDLAPVDAGDTPYVAFGVGDTVMVPDVGGRPPSRERVQAITVAMDDDGIVTYAPELRDALLDERERFAEAITKMANGTLGGESKVGTPTNMGTIATAKDCCPPAVPGWTISAPAAAIGYPTHTFTNSWESDADDAMASLTVSGNLAEAATETIQFWRNDGDSADYAVGTVTLVGPGFKTGTVALSEPLVPGSLYSFRMRIDPETGTPIDGLAASVAVTGTHANVTRVWLLAE